MKASLLLIFMLFSMKLVGSIFINPGLKARITPKGLSYAKDELLATFAKKITGTTISDFSGKSGSISYTISNTKIKSFSLPSSSLSINPGVGLNFKVSNVAASLHGDWKYTLKKIIKVSDHGNFDITTSSISFDIIIKIGKDSTGHISVSTESCKANVGSLKVKLHGGASWLYDLFKSKIADALKKSLSKVLCESASKFINENLEKDVATMKMTTELDQWAGLNYSLVNTPAFNNGYFDIDLKGAFYSLKNQQDLPFQPPKIATDNATSHMLYMWITDYVAKSAAYVYYQAGVMQYNITKDQVPKNVSFQLNTSALSFIFPGAEKKYPDKLMQLYFKSSEPPGLQISPDRVSFDIKTDIEGFAILSNNSLSNLGYMFTLNATMKGEIVNITIKGNDLVFATSYLGVEAAVRDTVIGDIKLATSPFFLAELCSLAIIPYLNEKGAKGIPLPSMDGVDFYNASVTLKTDYILLGTDIKYDPGSVAI